MNCKVSFIIIGKNEAPNIEKCINSIKRLNYNSYEIIYIDSNSTDNSEEILLNYSDVKYYKIISNRYTAALARSIGIDKSNGEYIFFLDGDMEVETDLDYCLNLLESNEVGIVSGELKDIWIKDNKIINVINNTFNVTKELEELKSPGGYFLTKKIDYLQSGGFKKELRCNEEVDLFSRYKKNNKKIYRTNKMCCIHNNIKDNKGKNHIVRMKEGYYTDVIRVIIDSIRFNYFKEYLSFRAQVVMIRSIIITILMMGCIIFSLKESMFLSIPIIYFLLLSVKYKFNIKLLKHNQVNNIMIILSIFLLGKNNKLEYEVVDMREVGEKNENKIRAY